MSKLNRRTLYTMREMDLLDFFAAQALPLVFKSWFRDLKDIPDDQEDLDAETMIILAQRSYEMAEAMIDAKETFSSLEN